MNNLFQTCTFCTFFILTNTLLLANDKCAVFNKKLISSVASEDILKEIRTQLNGKIVLENIEDLLKFRSILQIVMKTSTQLISTTDTLTSLLIYTKGLINTFNEEQSNDLAKREISQIYLDILLDLFLPATFKVKDFNPRTLSNNDEGPDPEEAISRLINTQKSVYKLYYPPKKEDKDLYQFPIEFLSSVNSGLEAALFLFLENKHPHRRIAQTIIGDILLKMPFILKISPELIEKQSTGRQIFSPQEMAGLVNDFQKLTNLEFPLQYQFVKTHANEGYGPFKTEEIYFFITTGFYPTTIPDTDQIHKILLNAKLKQNHRAALYSLYALNVGLSRFEPRLRNSGWKTLNHAFYMKALDEFKDNENVK